METLAHYINPYLGKVNQSILEMELGKEYYWNGDQRKYLGKFFFEKWKTEKGKRIPLVLSMGSGVGSARGM